MQLIPVEEIADILSRRLYTSCRGYTDLCRELLRLLARGQPVAPAQLAAALALDAAALTPLLRDLTKIEYDAVGNILACGLSLLPTMHHFEVQGHALYTWCAFDTLAYPTVLQQSARVASCCPITHAPITMTVNPAGMSDLQPADTYISLVLPTAAEAGCNIRTSFCNHVFFLSSYQAALTWLAQYPQAVLLPVASACEVAQLVAHNVYLNGSEHHYS